MHTIAKLCIIACIITGVTTVAANEQTITSANNAPKTIPYDLFAPVNRAMFGFNYNFANYVVIPMAGILDQTVPTWLKHAGANVYENLTEVEFMFTNLVDSHPVASAVSVARLAINSTVGIAGIFDVATAIGLKRRQVEISESFCNAGISPGPYVVFPLAGSTNLFGGGLMTGLLLTEWYLLSLIDETLAMGDAILDITVAAASLRHVKDIPESKQGDLYMLQQKEYWEELNSECTALAK